MGHLRIDRGLGWYKISYKLPIENLRDFPLPALRKSAAAQLNACHQAGTHAPALG
jgi:hypothetical protein